MAIAANITSDHQWFLGEDKKLRFAVYTSSDQTTALDVAAFALSWKLTPKPGDTAVITKTTGVGIAVTGAFNASPAVNTQRVEVTIDDTDTDAIAARTWWHELKRTDAGLEGVLAHGRVLLLRPVHLS